jgi:hypothetical protein
LNPNSQQNLSHKVVEHTYRLYGTHLLYAKDIPTYQAPNSESLRKLDGKTERWLRFEIEQSTIDSTINKAQKNKSVRELGLNDCLNLALYDQADPANLFLATIDNEKFEKMADK